MTACPSTPPHLSAPCFWRAGVCCSGWTQPGFRVSGWPGRSPQRSTGLSGQVRGRRAPGKQGSGLDQRGWGGPRWAESAAPGDRAAHHLRLALLLKRPVSLSRVWMKPGWMKHKLGSRLLGEISVTSDMQVTPPLLAKSEELKSLLIKVKEESWLKTQHSKMKIMASSPIPSCK